MCPGRLPLRAAAWGGLVSLLLAGSLWGQVPTPKARPQVPAPRLGQPAPAARERPKATEDDGVGSRQSVFVPADRTALLRLSDAQQLLDQQRYAEAVRLLGTLLESPEDYFFQHDQSSSLHRSLKAEAQRLLGTMPRQGRELYELQYGARARQLLGEAARAGNLSGVAEVARRFFHTQAGAEATLLLGLDHLDHDAPLAGALTLQRLQEAPAEAVRFEPTLSLASATCWLRAGMPDKAREALQRLHERQPQAKLSVGGREVTLPPDPTAALAALTALIGPAPAARSAATDQWTMFRGHPARNAAASGDGPLLSLRWQVLTYEHPYVQGILEQIEQLHQQRDQGYETLPCLQPLVVNNVVLMRTVRNLLAVDFTTGKRIWEVPVDDPFGRAAKMLDPSEGDSALEMERLGRQPRESEIHDALHVRLWGDATYGTLSSDGQLVFAIEDLDLPLGEAGPRLLNGRDANPPGAPRPYNRLAAYDLRSGKLKWNLGGSGSDPELPEAGVFFLGPPLPLMGELYVLGESKGEIRLLALKAKSGEVLWSQQLSVVDREILSDATRRMAGASPSYADGILICPTVNRSVVALELATRSLLWGYSYRDDAPADSDRQVFGFGMHATLPPRLTARWSDATATIVDGHVLVTPPDSNEIQCLNLLDGRLLWSQPRQDDLYLAGVSQGNVLLVGRDHLRAVRLEDGEPAWNGHTALFPQGSQPSGRGFMSGDRYYVPLSSAEVLAVAMDTGTIAHVFQARSGTVPGNLVCYQGNILSQRADALEAFYQLDALREEVNHRLANNAQDAEALALRGQILWDDGQLGPAVDALRQSFALSHDPRTRELLREALFEGLQSDFAHYRQQEDEILRLLDQPPQRAKYLRLMAQGLEAGAPQEAALPYYLQLIDLDREHHEMEVVDKSLAVRRDRWLQARLAALRAKAAPEVQAKVDRLAQTRLEEALQTKSLDALRQYLDYFGALPTAQPARRALLDRLIHEGRRLEAELLLSEQARSADPSTAAGAVAELAQLLREAERPQDAAICYQRLRTEFANVQGPSGQTGQQVFAALAADDPVRALLDPPPAWPVGQIKLETEVRAANAPFQASNPRTYLDFVGSPSPFFQDIDLEMSANPPKLIARDGLGQPLWELAHSDLTDPSSVVSAGLMHVTVEGHLLFVTLGSRVVAIDALVAHQGRAPRVLWSHDFGDEREEAAEANGPVVRPMAPMPAGFGMGGLQRFQLARSADASDGLPAVVSEQAFCMQHQRELVALDPRNGAVLWVRRGVEPNQMLFGDRDYLLLVPQGQNTATVVRTSDGSLVGTRTVPLQRVDKIGRYVLQVEDLPEVEGDSEEKAVPGSQAPERRKLQLFDPLAQRPVWPARQFPGRTNLCVVDNESVAALAPDGQFTLLRLSDGQPLLEAKLTVPKAALDPKTGMEEIRLFPSRDGYVLLANGGTSSEASGPRTYQIPSTSSLRIVRGWVWGFDRQGKVLWSDPIELHNQQLPLVQPRRLPVLAFACLTQDRRSGQNQMRTKLLFLDKRTGRSYPKEFLNTNNSFQLLGSPESKTVRMQLQRNGVRLTLTDQALVPLPPQRAALSEPPTAAKAVGKALLNTLRGKLQGLPIPSESEADAELEPPLQIPPKTETPAANPPAPPPAGAKPE